MFAYIWEYRVEPARIETFLRMYGPEGEWVRLFRRDPGYLRTELGRDAGEAERFVTIDYWTSREARDRFRQLHERDFAEIDRVGEGLTREERFIGDFDLLHPLE